MMYSSLLIRMRSSLSPNSLTLRGLNGDNSYGRVLLLDHFLERVSALVCLNEDRSVVFDCEPYYLFDPYIRSCLHRGIFNDECMSTVKLSMLGGSYYDDSA